MKEKIRAYAKVNIGLLVKEKRNDGYHNIDSYFAIINLYDEISIKIREGKETIVNIKRDKSYLDKGLDIMEKAALAFSKATGKTFVLDIDIEKNIPSKAGLGGGSSDGAEVFKFLNSYYKNQLSLNDLIDLSLSVGSDIPFFISGLKTARVKGRGEVIEKAEDIKGDIDLFFPSFCQETKDAYRILDEKERGERNLPSKIENLSYDLFPNDFELVVKRDNEIDDIAKNYRYFSLSGSGSTYYGLDKIKDYDFISQNIKIYNTYFTS